MISIKLINNTWPPQNGQYKNSLILYYDNWNDYGHRTSFGMSFCNESGQVFEVGSVKILHLEDDEEDAYALHTRDIIGSQIDRLDNTFCSLGQDLAYYKNLQKFLPAEYKDILARMNDIAVFDEIKERVWDCLGVQSSLLRFSSAEKALKEAKEVLGLLRVEEKDLSFDYLVSVPYDQETTKISFDFKQNKLLPYRLNVIIGKNGTGKTQILTQLANSLSGYTDDLEDDVFPNGRPAFDKIMSISYSAFDSFKRPKHHNADETRVLFSYVYCGIQSENGTLSLEQLQNNLKDAYSKVLEKDRREIWMQVLAELLEQEHSSVISLIEKEQFDGINLSSGQHILICTVTELIANIENESIILFDEPEIHLHPNAISNLLRMFNLLLEHFNSFAIFSTHSPLILQEVPSRYINILDRSENLLTVRKPDIECFGNNVSDIIFDAFDVSNKESNYKSVLLELSKTMSYDEILNTFSNRLSFNALIFLKSCYYSEGDA